MTEKKDLLIDDTKKVIQIIFDKKYKIGGKIYPKLEMNCD